MSAPLPHDMEQWDRAQQAYRALLAHIQACVACGAERPCEEGARIRRAVRAARLAALGRSAPWET